VKGTPTESNSWENHSTSIPHHISNESTVTGHQIIKEPDNLFSLIWGENMPRQQ
jgi:hypothetical protein